MKEQWKRNAVVATVLLFVCAAVYLNWNYGKEAASADAGKTLGQSAMVGGKTQDPLVGGDSSAATGVPSGDGSGEAQTGAEAQPGEESSGGAYFATARLNRQQARDSARRYLGCDLLILDDLGSEQNLPSARASLYEVVNSRLQTGRHTIISSNLSTREIGEKYGAQLASRVEGLYRELTFYGDDLRLQ